MSELKHYDRYLERLQLEAEEQESRALAAAEHVRCVSCKHLTVGKKAGNSIYICHYGDNPEYVERNWDCTYLYDEPYPYELETWGTI